MLLSYIELCNLVLEGVITPVEHDHINAASIDVRLGPTVLVERASENVAVVDYSKRQGLAMDTVDISGGHFDLQPGQFILAHTVEQFNLPNDVCAEFKLKSSGARIGLNNMLATWCDNGWHGSVLTLELHNVTRSHTIRLRAGDKIGQMLFYRTTPVPDDRSYAARGRYNKDTSAQGIKE